MKPDVEYRRGARAAAVVAATYNASSTHLHRLDDCILAKLNLLKGKVRRNRQAIAKPEDMFVMGMALALAEIQRSTAGLTAVAKVARNAGLTIAKMRAAGVDADDLKVLRRAGVK